MNVTPSRPRRGRLHWIIASLTLVVAALILAWTVDRERPVEALRDRPGHPRSANIPSSPTTRESVKHVSVATKASAGDDGVGIPADLVLAGPISEMTTSEVEDALDRLAVAAPLYWDLAPDARRLHDDLVEQLRVRLGVPKPADRLVAQPDRYLERARQIEEEMRNAH